MTGNLIYTALLKYVVSSAHAHECGTGAYMSWRLTPRLCLRLQHTITIGRDVVQLVKTLLDRGWHVIATCRKATDELSALASSDKSVEVLTGARSIGAFQASLGKWRAVLTLFHHPRSVAVP